jgi:hypothetical protein
MNALASLLNSPVYMPVYQNQTGAEASYGVLERIGPMARQRFIRYGDVT